MRAKIPPKAAEKKRKNQTIGKKLATLFAISVGSP
jgi:hypothetical protein